MLSILFVCTDDACFAGSSRSLLNLIDALGTRIHPIVLFSNDGVVPQHFRQHGIECIIQPFPDIMQRRKRLLTLLRHPKRSACYQFMKANRACAESVAKILHGRKIDFVHTNTSICAVGIALSKKLKAKHVWHVRELLDLHFSEPMLFGMPVLRKIVKCNSDARICISSAVSRHWHLTDRRSFVVWDAIRKAPDAGPMAKEKYFLTCAYLFHDSKASDQTVLAFAKSNVANEGYVLRLVGNCTEEYKQKLLSIAAEYHCEESLVFEGYHDDVSSYFKNATAFLMCSQNEGLGRVTAEAMLFGCPVIAHASGGTLDLVKHRVTGYFFHTTDECATLINEVAHADQSNVIIEALKFAAENFTEERYADKMMDIYKQVVES